MGDIVNTTRQIPCRLAVKGSPKAQAAAAADIEAPTPPSGSTKAMVDELMKDGREHGEKGDSGQS